jgi:hypothetical protein
MESAMNKSEYDLNFAITFLLVGLGIGSVLSYFSSIRNKEARQRKSIVGACQGCDHEGKQRSE